MKSLPKNRPLNEIDIHEWIKKLNIHHFRGVFMRNSLPSNPLQRECGIINLDTIEGPGTHWVAYYRNKKTVNYFDSFGNLPPPIELVKYLGSDCKIYYNYKKYQNYGSINCGQLCLHFLYEFNKQKII
jgi:hypothetical protein